jgi:hypothetical protein
MYDLNSDDMLSKIHLFKLDRPDGWCYISVHEVIASEKAKLHYIAVPNMAVQQTDQEYFGIGEDVEGALSECLKKIKTVPITTLFPSLQRAYGESPTDPQTNG